MTFTRPPVLLVALALFVAASACGGSSPTAPDQRASRMSQTDFTVGTGAEATAGKTATVQYAGWLYNETGQDKKGAQFDCRHALVRRRHRTVIKGSTPG